MALTHLVDTSVLTRLAEPTVRAALEPLAALGRVGSAGISDLEVGFSARSVREWDELQNALGAFDLAPSQEG
jgi:predicted nucleic acid-binding protein